MFSMFPDVCKNRTDYIIKLGGSQQGHIEAPGGIAFQYAGMYVPCVIMYGPYWSIVVFFLHCVIISFNYFPFFFTS